MNQFYKNMMTLAMGMLVLLAIFSFWSSTPEESDEITYSQFMERLENGEIAEVRIQDQVIEGRTRSDESFRSFGPVEDERRSRLLRENGVDTVYQPRDDSGIWNTLLISWLPMILFIGLWFLLFRQLQSGGGKAMSFGKAKARLLSENQQRVTFQDVAGIEEAEHARGDALGGAAEDDVLAHRVEVEAVVELLVRGDGLDQGRVAQGAGVLVLARAQGLDGRLADLLRSLEVGKALDRLMARCSWARRVISAKMVTRGNGCPAVACRSSRANAGSIKFGST